MAWERHGDLTGLLPRLAAFARVLLGDADKARDLVQEAVARALAAGRVPDEKRAYRAWMFRIVRNAAIDELRSWREEVSDAEIVPDIWGFDDACIAKITVEQGLESLTAQHREIIALIDIAGMSYCEAAEFLDVPVGTVMSRIARARTLLLAAIETSTVRPLKSSRGRGS